jgi:hypothetical protein
VSTISKPAKSSWLPHEIELFSSLVRQIRYARGRRQLFVKAEAITNKNLPPAGSHNQQFLKRLMARILHMPLHR